MPQKYIEYNCYGYWFAAPQYSDIIGLLGVNYKGELCANSYMAYWGIRPVIHLNSDIKASWNEEEEIWELH